MKKICVISNCSTYHTAPRGIQANRIINGLSKKFFIYLITSTKSIPDEGDYFSENVAIVRAFRETPAVIQRGFSRIWPFLGAFDIFWYLKARKIAFKISKRENISDIICLAIKFSNILAGIWVGNRLPLVAVHSFLSDPISLNPYISKSRLDELILQKIEKYFFAHSKHIVFPSQKMKEAYETNYPRIKNKFFYIPHSFKVAFGKDTTNSTVRQKDRVIRYIGSLNSQRNPIALCQFIIQSEQFFQERSIRFEFVGPTSSSLKQTLKLINSRIIAFKPKVKYLEAKGLMKTSFALLVIDADFSNSTFLPSKIVESMSSERPIIGITPNGSESQRVLEMTGNFVITEKTIYKIKDIVEYLIANDYVPYSPQTSEFAIDSVVDKWMFLLERNHQG